MAEYTVRLPDDLDAQVDAEAQRQGLSKAELWRTAMAVYLDDCARGLVRRRLDRIERALDLGPLD